MRHTSVLFAGLFLSACSAQVVQPPAPPPPSNLSADIEFHGYMQNGFPEQDVYIQTYNGSQTVERFEVRPTQNLDLMAKTFARPVYTTISPLPHDPFKTQSGSLGPYPIGGRIGLVLQAWGSGRGYGTYSVQDGTATLDADFHGLMRGGTYSLWCSKISEAATVDWPCVPAAGSGVVIADGKGGASLRISFPAPPDTTTETGSYLSLAYHSDHHKDTRIDDFGKTTHVQILAKIPPLKALVPAY